MGREEERSLSLLTLGCVCQSKRTEQQSSASDTRERQNAEKCGKAHPLRNDHYRCRPLGTMNDRCQSVQGVGLPGRRLLYHRPTKSLLLCDAVVAVSAAPPPVLLSEPEYRRTLQYHARDEPTTRSRWWPTRRRCGPRGGSASRSSATSSCRARTASSTQTIGSARRGARRCRSSAGAASSHSRGRPTRPRPSR